MEDGLADADQEWAWLSARNEEDVAIIENLWEMKEFGWVVIEHAEALEDEAVDHLAQMCKVMADEEQAGSKLVLVGEQGITQRLVDFAPDLTHRMGRVNADEGADVEEPKL